MGADAAPLRLAVVGGGWAGLAAAVRATQAGHRVTLVEMAPQFGGRARALTEGGDALDNGQHILIGAYVRTLDLMRTVGVDIAATLHRQPLQLRYPDGRGLRLPRGAALPAFVRAVLGCSGWGPRDKLTLLAVASRWALMGFRCPPDMTVATLCAALPPPVRQLLIDPLCVAALNTPASDASANVLLRVLRDALFSGPGSADLLLPREPLSALLPEPAARWLREAGATLRLGQRAQALVRDGRRWRLDGEPFDAVVLACSAHEAARLAADHAPDWAQRAAALRYEPIVTVYLHCAGARLPSPMTALLDSATAPAQFVFDHGALGGALGGSPSGALGVSDSQPHGHACNGRPGRFAFVISGARRWVDAGSDATAAAVLRQAQTSFAPGTWPQPPTLLRTITEKRATFRCTPVLDRPPAHIASALVAAGDYVDGPYPATLEGAVHAGEAAVRSITAVAAACR